MITEEEAKYQASKFKIEDKHIQASGELYYHNVPKEHWERWKNETGFTELEKKQSSKQEVPIEYLEILENPDLFNLITEQELDKKIVGEIQTRKVIFLCANGRLVENHQTASYNLLVNDEAGTGKDYTTGAVLEITPKETYIHKTRISPAVFTYWHNPKFEPEWTWDGKVFYPEDISELVLNSDVFKVMTSKGSSATIVIKQQAIEIDIKGKPVMITTTATATPNPELTRRFVILNLDSSQDQTRAIMKRHSLYKKNGIVPEYDQKFIEAQKYLKRVKVKIPFADWIDDYFPTKNIIMRTNYPRFLDFISASTAFHQYQRNVDSDSYYHAEAQDYDLARECFIKLCSNKYMIPLTINQKKILSFFEENPEIKASVSQLHSSKMNFISLANLQINLQNLAKYGILETSNTKDAWNREMEVYSISKGYNPNEKLDIPTFEELMQKYNNSSEKMGGIIDINGIIVKKCKNNANKNEDLDKESMQNNNSINNTNNTNSTIIPIIPKEIDFSEVQLYE